MAYARHALLQFGGSLLVPNGSTAGKEIWSCGIRVAYNRPLGADQDLDLDAQEEYLNDTAIPALTDWFSDGDTLIGATATLDWAKFNAIDPQGHYLNDGTTVADITGVRGGGGSPNTPKYPTQVSLAVTFETGKTRGRAKAGRIYLPAPCHVMGSDGMITQAEANRTLATTSNLLGDLTQYDNTLAQSFAPVVATKLPPKGAGGTAVGEMNAITALRIDSRLDIQTRRANALVAARYRRTLAE